MTASSYAVTPQRMRRLAGAACAATMMCSSSVSAHDLPNQTAADQAGAACVAYLTKRGAPAAALQKGQFSKRGNTYTHKATRLGLSGHSDRASIELKKSECLYRYGSDRGSSAAIDAFMGAFRKARLTEVVVKSGRYRVPAFEIGGKYFKVYASTGTQRSAFFTNISVSAR